MSYSKVDLLGSSSEDSDDLCIVAARNYNFPLYNPEEEDEEVEEEEEEQDAFAGVCLVSVLSPSAVTHAISCHFTSLSDTNLILGRGTRLEILVLRCAKLQVVSDIHYCGRIMALECLCSSAMATDSLCLLTELSPNTYELRILQWNSDDNIIKLSDKVAIPNLFGEFSRKKICCIDREKKLIGLLFCFRFKVWRLSSEGILEEIVSFRVGSTRIEDICFLPRLPQPTFMIHYKHHDSDLWSKLEFSDLGEIVHVEQLEDYYFSSLVPLPSCDGFIGISPKSVRLKMKDDFDTADFEHDIVASTFTIDGSLLIADAAGHVYMVQISEKEEQISLDSSMVADGTSIASTLAALTDEFIFIGSSSGDSQLVKLHGPVIDTLDSISPVVDMCMLQQDAGQKIVVASGSYKDGSLRSISHSCTFKSIDSIEIVESHVDGFWTHVEDNTLRLVYSIWSGFTACEVSLEALWSNDDTQIQSCDITTTTLGGFDNTKMHLYLALGLCHVQVTSGAVILLNSKTGFVNRWNCPGCISVAASFEDKVFVAYGKCLTLLQISGNNLEVIGSTEMPDEVSCLNIGQGGSMVAIGMWHRICLASFPLLSEMSTIDVDADMLIRTVLLFQFHEVLYLVYGDTGGSVGFYQKQDTLIRLSKVRCSSTAVNELKTILVDGVNHILAVSETPVVLCIKNGVFTWMPLTLRHVSFLSVVEPNRCFWILQNEQGDETEYGTIESVVNVECLMKTKAHGRNICFQKSSSTFMVATCENGLNRQEHSVRHSLRLYNLTYETIASFALHDLEYGWSITSGRFLDNGEEFYCVGTVYVDPDNQSGVSSHSGRILVFRIEQEKLRCLVSKDVRGPVYALQFCSNKLLATVYSSVCMYSLNQYHGWELYMVDSQSGDVANTHGLVNLATFSNRIVAGASVGSPYLLEHKDELEVLIDQPIDGFGGSSGTICISGDLFISANLDNLVLSFHAPHKNRWKSLGDVFIGEFITGVQPFCIPLASQSSKPQPWVFSTAVGRICCVIPLLRRELDLLAGLCRSFNRLLKDELYQMREWKNPQSVRFIDGDYIRCLLSLDESSLQAIAQEFDVSLDVMFSLIRYIASFQLI